MSPIQNDHESYPSALTILRSAEKARDLTGQLLNFCRPREAHSKVFNLNPLIEESLVLLRQVIPSSVMIAKDLDPGLANVEGEPSQLQQVLMNLCVNARDAMGRGGTLTIRTRNVPGGAGSESVTLQVEDTGTGMSKQVRQKIFDPFFSTKDIGKGTGLGLAVAYGIVNRHAGSIEVRSRLGIGSCFQIRLPASSKPLARGCESQPCKARGTETILVVDDEKTVRDLACRILEEHGYRTFSARDGETALLVYRENWQAIDLILLDLTMPRLSGGDCLRCIQEINPDVRLVLSSGYSMEEPEDLAQPSTPFLAKPYGPDDLLRMVRRALDTLPSVTSGAAVAGSRSAGLSPGESGPPSCP